MNGIETSMNIVIEKASKTDALKLIKTRNRSFYNDYVKFRECHGYNISENEMKNKIENNSTYKILADGEIIGDISVHKREEGYYWIGCLEIIPEFQNKGIGSMALFYVQKQFRDVKIWGLETPVQDCRNCWFYEKMGLIKAYDRIHSEKLTLRIYEKFI